MYLPQRGYCRMFKLVGAVDGGVGGGPSENGPILYCQSQRVWWLIDLEEMPHATAKVTSSFDGGGRARMPLWVLFRSQAVSAIIVCFEP